MHQGNNGLKFWELVQAKCIDNAVPGRCLMMLDANAAACAVCGRMLQAKNCGVHMHECNYVCGQMTQH